MNVRIGLDAEILQVLIGSEDVTVDNLVQFVVCSFMSHWDVQHFLLDVERVSRCLKII